MAERMYTEEEVAEILRRATRLHPSDVSDPPAGSGLTLPQLHDIGREVGISPAAMSEAAHSLGRREAPPSPTFLGFQIGVSRRAEFDYALDDTDWEELVGDLRDTFRARGTLRYDGRFRQWTNGNLQALLEPTAAGYRLRLQTVKANARPLMIGGVIYIAAGVIWGIAAVPAGIAGASAGMSGIVLLGVALFAAAVVGVRRWARRRAEQMAQIINRVAARHDR